MQMDCAERNETKNYIENTEHHTEYENSERAETDYSRPAWRSGVRDEVWKNARDEQGRVRDPLSGRYMSKDQPWDIGHEPGYEFRKYQEYARSKQMSRAEFIDGYNNTEHLRPELPASNRSHRCEDMTDRYFTEEEENYEQQNNFRA